MYKPIKDIKKLELLIIALLLTNYGLCDINDEEDVLDLTYDLDNQSISWPIMGSFVLTEVIKGEVNGMYIAANNVTFPEHIGTHMDSPNHFFEGGFAAHAVPLSTLIGNAVVIDMREKSKNNTDALLMTSDLHEWENKNGLIPERSIIIILTGWGKFWPNKKMYLGNDKDDPNDLHFPGVSPEAALWLVDNRDIKSIGIDTASIDHGPSKDFMCHRIFSERNIPILENLANIDKLPTVGSTIYALPIKIKDGTGALMRVIAINWEPEEEDEALNANKVEHSINNSGVTMTINFRVRSYNTLYILMSLCLLCSRNLLI